MGNRQGNQRTTNMSKFRTQLLTLGDNGADYVFRYGYPTAARAKDIMHTLRANFIGALDIQANYHPLSSKMHYSAQNENGNRYIAAVTSQVVA
jgi:hypothetical protein